MYKGYLPVGITACERSQVGALESAPGNRLPKSR